MNRDMATQILTETEEKEQIYKLRNYIFKEMAHAMINGDLNEKYYNTIFDCEEDLIYYREKHVVLDLDNKSILDSSDNLEDCMNCVLASRNDTIIWQLPLHFDEKDYPTELNVKEISDG